MKEIIASMGVYDYGKNKLCDLYDSQNSIRGQAYNISFKQSMADGIHELTFTIPYMTDGEENFRWAYMRNEYLIRLKYDGKIMWYIATKPVRSKSGGEVVGTVTCKGTEALLKTRNIYMEFDDTNGIGTADELTDRVLAGTGWHRGYTDPMLEADGVTEKVRSITSGGKDGALGLMSKICNVFKCYPVYDSDSMTVALYSFNNRDQVLEGTVGGNLNALTVTPDSESMITRMYVEGEYGDNGYVGIDDVNPTGLSYLMNFDYYREIGVMTPAQETALAKYTEDISEIKRQIMQNTAAMIESENAINELIGQCNLTLYYVSAGINSKAYIWGEPTDAQKALSPGSEVIILNGDGTYRYDTVVTDAEALIRSGDYGIAKFGTPASGIIGAKEIQVEAKEKEIENLRGKISRTQKEDKIAEYTAEIEGLEAGIRELYEDPGEGLYALMSRLLAHDGLLETLVGQREIADSLSLEQDDIESDFIIAMGPLLRDGYWSNQNYVPGQEQALYNDAVDVMKEMSRPATSYTFDYVRVVEDFGIPIEDIRLNAVFRINDDELKIHENLFITNIVIGVDDLSSGGIEVSNRDITLNSNDLGALLSRMSQLADLIEQKNTLYDRAKAISKNGTLYTDRLNGQIDVLKTKIMSSVSNWYTDENGNILFESADGGSAMMLSGAGFLLANSKTEDGEWNWRAAGDGSGFTADEIVAGFLSADRIEAGSIATSKVTPDFGNTLVITNNPSITGIEAAIKVLPDSIIAEVMRYGHTYVQLTDPTLDEDKKVIVGDLWMIGNPDGDISYDDAKGMTNEELMAMNNAGTMSGYKDVYRWDGEKWVYVFDTAIAGEAYAKVIMTDERIETEVARINAVEGTVMTRISQTATDIELEASRATESEGVLRAAIQVNAERITSEVTRLDAADTELGTQITQTATDITLGNIKAGAVDTQGSTVVIGASGISMKTGATFTVQSNNFKIDSSGNVEMSGKVTASSGEIGGFVIGQTYITSNKNKTAYNDTTYDAVYVGTDGIGLGKGKFMVSNAGALTANSGSIGGWTISDKHIGSGTSRGTSAVGMSNYGDDTYFAFWAGYTPQASPSDSITGTAKFSVTKGGYLHAQDGEIGGWTIGATTLYSGSGTACVGMDSDPNGAYAIWAGSQYAADGKFRVKRDGTVILNKLEILDENGTPTTVDLTNQSSTYPMWKLNYGVIKNIDPATGTVETTMGNFKSAASVRLHSLSVTSVAAVGNRYLVYISGELTNGKIFNEQRYYPES